MQTPTLAIVVEREEKIRALRAARLLGSARGRSAPRRASTTAAGSTRNSRRDDDDPEQRAERLWDEAAAEAIVAAKCRGKPGTVTEEAKPTTQIVAAALRSDEPAARGQRPLRLLGARTRSSLAQALYEKHKVLTYPRTDSRALPEDYLAHGEGHARTMLKETQRLSAASRSRCSTRSWVKPNKRIFDNAKISDHFAIIPTLQAPKRLTEPEQKLYDLVVKRFLAVFYPAAEFLVTTRITRRRRRARSRPKARCWSTPGWLAVYGKEAQADEDANARRRCKPDEKVDDREGRGRSELVTKPPARYTEATLLSAMEGAGKLVDDEELREAMAREGPRHAGDARGDHRRADRREVHPARRPRAASRPPRRSR